MNIYDAWNRLVEVRIDENGDGNYDEVRARYGYNGLHQRTTRRANSNDQVIDGDDPGHLYYYDASWRMLEERIDAAWDGANNTFNPEKIVQRVWDPLYIDALIAMQTDINDDMDSGDPDGDFTDADADIYYAVLDRKYDVIAMMNDSGVIRERVRYTPYGVAQNHPNTDLNGDGAVNGADLADYLASGGSRADTDFNRDGSVDGADLATLLSSYTVAEPEGVLSRLGNTIGYSGYVYDDAINASLARFRWYEAEMGRWGTRDPLEYVDGSSRYPFVQNNPVNRVDPMGLASKPPFSSPGSYVNDGQRLIRDLRKAGFNVVNTGGKHPWKVILPNGTSTPIPTKPGIGTVQKILKTATSSGGVFLIAAALDATATKANAAMILPGVEVHGYSSTVYLDPRSNPAFPYEWSSRAEYLEDADGDYILDYLDPNPDSYDRLNDYQFFTCLNMLNSCLARSYKFIENPNSGCEDVVQDPRIRDNCIKHFKSCLSLPERFFR